jgi:hypothetical protein
MLNVDASGTSENMSSFFFTTESFSFIENVWKLPKLDYV